MINDELNKIAAEAAKEVYEDGLKDTVKSSGRVLSLIPRAIHAALSGVEKWILNKEYSIKETQKLLELKLANVKPEEIEEPDAYVAVPTINALSYSYASEDLLNFYANLLASSMIANEKWKVHPSFVEIIKQLSPDEAKLLVKIANHKGPNEFPIFSLLMEKEGPNSVERYIALRNFTDLGYGICDFPENISSYIDNLVRLNIIEIRTDEKVSGYNYSSLFRHHHIVEYKKSVDLEDGFEWKNQPFLFIVTNFGKSFINVCVDNKAVNNSENNKKI